MIPSVFALEEELIDEYVAGGGSYNDIDLTGIHPSGDADKSAIGQCFNVTKTHSYAITTCSLYLKRVGNPIGNLTAQLYNFTGTFGTNGKPVGSVLAESNKVNMTNVLTGASFINFTFPEGEQYVMTHDIPYCIECVVKEATVLNATNRIEYHYKTSDSHEGNGNYFLNNGWLGSAVDFCFRVFGVRASYDIGFYIHDWQNLPVKNAYVALNVTGKNGYTNPSGWCNLTDILPTVISLTISSHNYHNYTEEFNLTGDTNRSIQLSGGNTNTLVSLMIGLTVGWVSFVGIVQKIGYHGKSLWIVMVGVTGTILLIVFLDIFFIDFL